MVRRARKTADLPNLSEEECVLLPGADRRLAVSACEGEVGIRETWVRLALSRNALTSGLENLMWAASREMPMMRRLRFWST